MSPSKCDSQEWWIVIVLAVETLVLIAEVIFIPGLFRVVPVSGTLLAMWALHEVTWGPR